MGNTIRAGQIMKQDFVVVSPSLPVKDAIEKLMKENLPMLIVVSDDDQSFVGVFSEYDALKPFLNTVYFDSDRGLVKDFMSRDLVYVGSDEELLKVAAKFVDTKVRCLPVVEGKNVVGIIVRHTLIKALHDDWLQKEKQSHPKQAPIIGQWGNRFKGEGGSALPEGFEGKFKKKN